MEADSSEKYSLKKHFKPTHAVKETSLPARIVDDDQFQPRFCH
jgi:hypothetical protein